MLVTSMAYQWEARTEQDESSYTRSEAAIHHTPEREVQAMVPMLVDVKLLWPLRFWRTSLCGHLSRHYANLSTLWPCLTMQICMFCVSVLATRKGLRFGV